MDHKLAKDRLIEAIHAGKLVVLIGAGASMDPPSELPNWWGLVKSMAEFVRNFQPKRAELMLEELDQGSLFTAIDLFSAGDKIPPQERSRFFRELFDKSYSHPAPAYSILAKLPAAHWITTNYDNNLKQALAGSRVGGSQAEKGDVEIVGNSTSDLRSVLSLWNEKRFGVYLHGRAYAYESLVYSTKTYTDIRSRAEYRELLKRIFLENTVLAYGFSFKDPAFEATLSYVANDLGGATARSHFVLTSDPGSLPHGDLERCGFVVLPYSAKNKHEEAKQFIDALSRNPKVTAGVEKGKLLSNDREREFRALTSVFMSVSDPGRSGTYEKVCLSLIRRVLVKARSPLTIEDVKQELCRLAHVSKDTSDRMFRAARPTLFRVGIEFLSDDRLVLINNPPSSDDDGLALLVDAVSNRLQTYKAGSHKGHAVGDSIRKAISHVMIAQGMGVARAFANQDQPEAYALVDLVEEGLKETNTPGQIHESLKKSIVEVLAEPSPECSEILFRLAHAAYALESVFLNPLEVNLGKALLWRIYIDSNVILRLVSPSAQGGTALRDLFSKLRGLGAPLAVLYPFITEITQHVTLLGRTLGRLKIRSHAALSKHVSDLPRAERSPILSWYLHASAQFGWVSFEEFAKGAKLSSESELTQMLSSYGIEVDGRDAVRQLDTSSRETLWDSLRKWRGRQHSVGARRLRRNEATQVEWLARLREKGTRSWFLSVDGQLRQALKVVEGGKYSGFVMTPTAWAYKMADLHWGEMNVTGFAEMMWSLPERSAGERMQYAAIRRIIEEAPDGMSLEPEFLRDRVEEFFLRGKYAESVETIDDPVEREAGLENVLEQVMPKAVEQILDALVKENSRRDALVKENSRRDALVKENSRRDAPAKKKPRKKNRR